MPLQISASCVDCQHLLEGKKLDSPPMVFVLAAFLLVIKSMEAQLIKNK